MRVALTIAGSDSGGGAGIQADLKTFAAHGVYGTSAITAVTAQNTEAVLAWQALPPALIRAQIEAVVTDIGVHAVKTGMLATADVVRVVASAIDDLRLPYVVVDPVMVAKGGHRLIEPEAERALREDLLPRAYLVTPNVPEAEVLIGMPVRTEEDLPEAAQQILAMGPKAVLIKGGHLEGEESVDLVCSLAETFLVRGPRIASRSTHGTGCTLASAIAANLALGADLRTAIERAREYLEGALRHAPGLGRGHGPLDHFWRGILK
jgi:hydroxymethylpyrimidine/phosphomethylpyrimidine kinase